MGTIPRPLAWAAVETHRWCWQGGGGGGIDKQKVRAHVGNMQTTAVDPQLHFHQGRMAALA